MKKLDTSLIKSLFFPLFLLASLLLLFVVISASSPRLPNPFNKSIIIFVLIGSVVPILLTIFIKVDTSGYIKTRVFWLLISIGLCILSWLLFFTSTFDFIILIIPIILIIINTIYYFFKCKTFKEWLVICLSNPIIYYLAIIIQLIVSINKNGFYNSN